jgi:APA family basic amino acid/polyamine antiporter
VSKKLSTSSAVYIGLASMLGAGVFVVFGPAASFAGSLLPLAVLIAGFVAYLNAGSIAQLAAVVPRSGGAYSYARHYISPAVGFAAGAAFLIGKLGSVAAIALTFATYLAPGFEVLVAVLGIIAMTLINIMGINRTALGAKILASITIGFLVLVMFTSLFAWSVFMPPAPGDGFGVLTAASLFFFAFAGYARVATLGGEVEDPTRNIPRAIAISLGIVLAIYLLLSVMLVKRLGTELAFTLTPLADISPLPGPFASVFAAVAALGSLLALIAGMSRTAATMAQDGELPAIFARLNSKGTPYLAEWAIALAASALVLTESVAFVIGFSSFAVLTYYAIANWAGYVQPRGETKRPKYLNLLGLALCLLLLASVPPDALLFGLLTLAVVIGLRWGLAKLG